MGTRAVRLVVSAKALGLLALLVGCTARSGAQSQATLGPPAAASAEPVRAPEPDVAPECLGGESWRPGATTVCNSQCRSQSFSVTRCVESRREEVLLRAPCECGPATLSPELSGCRLDQVSLVPPQVIPRTRSSELVTQVDGCKLELACWPGKLTISCDGEQDGTGTSLCECYLDGLTVRLPKSDPWPGEGANTCHAAAALCLQVATSK